MPLPNAQPKPRPRLLDKRERESQTAKIDREERAKCKARSGGQCEVFVRFVDPFRQRPTFGRCRQRATENHHLISGIGRRNRGRSILAIHRLDTCSVCHREITNNVLVPIDGTKKELAAEVRYERIR